MYVKQNERFLVRSHWIPTHARPGKWRLTIDDEVERPTQITLFALKKLPDAGRRLPCRSTPPPPADRETAFRSRR